jgi:CheY-like chemotaxis protein
MTDGHSSALHRRRFLVVEDEYLVAATMVDALEELGAEAIGPAGTVEDALRLIESEGSRLDGAVLDVNLHGVKVFPVARALAAHGVPFIFATGYDAIAIPEEFGQVPRCEKPVGKALLAKSLKIGDESSGRWRLSPPDI